MIRFGRDRCFLARDAVLKSTPLFVQGSVRLQVVKDGVEDAVNKLVALLRAEFTSDFDCFIDGDFGRYVVEVKEFANAHTKYDLVDDGKSVEFPMCNLFLDEAVELLFGFHDFQEERFCKLEGINILFQVYDDTIYHMISRFAGELVSVQCLQYFFADTAASMRHIPVAGEGGVSKAEAIELVDHSVLTN